ncbi:MAG: hypothetical protein Q7N50_06940 [Armatimonadota bacterium]|nr:hypothetical protein [Armatimonadota bacterium]
MRVVLIVVAFAVALALFASPVLAYTYTLNLIPTADFYEKGSFSLELESSGEGKLLDFGGGCDEFMYLQFGVNDRLEAGIDTCLENGDKVYNAKYLLRQSEKSPVAIGLQNVGVGARPQTYAVAGFGFDRSVRSHLGLMRIEGKTRALLGADTTYGALTFMADYISGRDNESSLGVYWETGSFGVTYSSLFPNSSGPTGFVFNIQYIGKLGR